MHSDLCALYVCGTRVSSDGSGLKNAEQLICILLTNFSINTRCYTGVDQRESSRHFAVNWSNFEKENRNEKHHKKRNAGWKVKAFSDRHKADAFQTLSLACAFEKRNREKRDVRRARLRYFVRHNKSAFDKKGNVRPRKQS